MSGFRCCFCAKGIEENKVDPCDMIVVTNTDRLKKGPEEEASQQFYCHVDCLRTVLHKNVRGYLVIDSCVDDE